MEHGVQDRISVTATTINANGLAAATKRQRLADRVFRIAAYFKGTLQRKGGEERKTGERKQGGKGRGRARQNQADAIERKSGDSTYSVRTQCCHILIE